MAGMDDLSFSLAMRDIVNSLVKEAIEQQRPKYRYGTVVSIDRPNYKCTITYNGETGQVIVNMGSIQPSAVGQRVRIEGIGTDKFITDVIGGAVWYGDINGDMTVPGRFRLPSTSDAGDVGQYPTSPTGSTGHPFQIGPDNGFNTRMDNNEIMALNNGVLQSFIIHNPVAGQVQGTGSSALTRKDYVDRARTIKITGAAAATQSMPSGGGFQTIVNFNATEIASTAFATTATGKITCVTPGAYLVGAKLSLKNSGTIGNGTEKYINLNVNGAPVNTGPQGWVTPNTSSAHTTHINAGAVPLVLNANDYLQLTCTHDTGATEIAALDSSFLYAVFLHP